MTEEVFGLEVPEKLRGSAEYNFKIPEATAIMNYEEDVIRKRKEVIAEVKGALVKEKNRHGRKSGKGQLF